MTELKERTTFYNQKVAAPDNLHGPGAYLGLVATGSALSGANLWPFDEAGANAGGTLFFSADEPTEKRYWCARTPAFSGYYVIAHLPGSNSPGSGLAALLDDGRWEARLPCPVLVGGSLGPSNDVRTVESQRAERRATAALAQKVASLLPSFSERDLGRLVGVSRIAWRGWVSGETAARRGKRQRLLRIERILSLRAHVDPDTPLSHWLDAPLGRSLDSTPARLLAEGKDQLVAVLAARLPAAEVDERRRLGVSPAIAGLLDQLPVDDALAVRREIYADDQEDEAG
jgi:hypothetical protein